MMAKDVLVRFPFPFFLAHQHAKPPPSHTLLLTTSDIRLTSLSRCRAEDPCLILGTPSPSAPQQKAWAAYMGSWQKSIGVGWLRRVRDYRICLRVGRWGWLWSWLGIGGSVRRAVRGCDRLGWCLSTRTVVMRRETISNMLVLLMLSLPLPRSRRICANHYPSPGRTHLHKCGIRERWRRRKG